MNCAELHENLPLLSHDPAPAELLVPAVEHAAGCPRCARLLAAARGDAGPAGATIPPELLPAVLARTVGSPCERIADRLAEHADGELRGFDASLVRRHLEGCAACREVVEALRVLRAELPRLAEAEPDVRFVVDVLARTSWARRETATPAAGLRRAWETLHSDAPRLFRRPRAALELAYGAGLFLYLAAGSPHEALRELSTRSSAWMEEGWAAREEGLSELREPLEEAAARLKAAAARPREELAALPAPGTARQVVETAGKLLRTAELTWRGLQAAGRCLLRGNFGGIWKEFLTVQDEIRRCWAPAPPGRAEIGTEPSPPPLRSSQRAP